MVALSSLHMFVLVRYTLLLVRLLTFTTCLPIALAILRSSAPLEIPMALTLSAVIVIVESERTLLFFWDPPTGLPSFPFRVYPIATQIHCSCQFLFCRFKNFSPETLVTFLLRLWLLQIMLYAFITFFFLLRRRAIHTWTTKHPITSVIPNG